MKTRKVVLIGCGAVGTSFLYSALNQGLFDEYVLIDVFEDLAKGNTWDFEDANAILLTSGKIKLGTYEDCGDADVVVVTAGVPQKPGETRLELIDKNARIMKNIAENVKDSGFDGITIIASNPVDILGKIYQVYSGYDENKVLPTGTILDSARLKHEISKRIDINPNSIQAYVIGEHGDSSVSVFSEITIGSIPLDKYKKFSVSQKRAIHKAVMTKAYKIINTKRATFYGIGACIARICRAIVRDENAILPISAITKNTSNLYIGWPAVVNKDGWSLPLKLNLTAEEKKGFNKSVAELKKVYENAIEKLNQDNE